jgi:hypothetical protein
MVEVIVALLLVGAGYGFRGLIRKDIAKVVAAVKAEESKLTSATADLKKL